MNPGLLTQSLCSLYSLTLHPTRMYPKDLQQPDSSEKNESTMELEHQDGTATWMGPSGQAVHCPPSLPSSSLDNVCEPPMTFGIREFQLRLTSLIT